MVLKSVVKRRKRISFIILTIVSIVWMVPIVWGMATSLKSPIDIASNPISLIPKELYFDNYLEIFTKTDTPVLRWMLNSLIIAVAHTGLYLIFASLAAYSFSVMKWKGKDKLFWLILSTTMIPAVINLVPLITMMIDVGWFGTWWALIIPGLGGVFGMFLLRQFFLGIPTELIDSAKIDGLGSFGVFSKIVIPLSKSAFMVAGLFAFLGSWNDYLWPLIVMSGEDMIMQTLPVGLSKIASTYNYNYGLTMAAAILSIIPVVIVYAFTQDKIIEGVSRAGIK
ncbi:carbohydrate ABC transporter permease [Candidatus Izemoplasma sp. B36]|uniref:carbohydrate ABC transporter permease n=1 Tax=Candidatus Izemoplasma sp. B36 TaxID=3242468 RepID=UPI00355759B1